MYKEMYHKILTRDYGGREVPQSVVYRLECQEGQWEGWRGGHWPRSEGLTAPSTGPEEAVPQVVSRAEGA